MKKSNYYINYKPLSNQIDHIEINKKNEFWNQYGDSSSVIKRVLLLVICFTLTIIWPQFSLLLLLALILIIYEVFETLRQVKKDIKNAKFKLDKKKLEFIAKNKDRKKQTDLLTIKLNSILKKSIDFVEIVIPKEIEHLEKSLSKIKFEYEENALIPFWDEIEKFISEMDSFNKSISLLNTNRELYHRIIKNTENNFPENFPSIVNETKINRLIENFEHIKREAFKNFEFANLWEQRKTQKVLAFGFSTLKDAIDNMSISISSAIDKLNHSVVNGFGKMSYYIEKIDFNTNEGLNQTNSLLEKNLSNIDQKLYYIQYNRKPIEPFNDIIAPER